MRLSPKYMVAAAILSFAALSFAAPLGYFSLETPQGIKGGMTFPDGVPSHFGSGLLISDYSLFSVLSDGTQLSIAKLDTNRSPARVFPVDVDSDGFLDLLTANRDNGGVKIIVGSEDEDTLVITLPTQQSPVLAAATAMFDSDNLPDIILADSSVITVYTRNVSGELAYSFFKEISLNRSTENLSLASQEMLTGDFLGDRHDDIVYKGSLYINSGEGKVQTRSLPTPSGVKVKLLGLTIDSNNDGKDELLWSSATAASQPCVVSIARYDAVNIFQTAKVLQTGLQEISSAFLYNSDSDSYLEPGFYSEPDAKAVGYDFTASGLNTFSQAELFTTSTMMGEFLGPLPSDTNGETGWLFIDPDVNTLYTGYLRRPYADATEESGLLENLAGQSVAVGDYNGDNLPDIYVVNYSGDNALYRGEPDGTFTEVAAEAGVAQGNDGISCAWGDFNNDGFQDLVVAGLWHPDKLFYNRGDGTFADSSGMLRFSKSNQRATSVSWGDVNRDGWLDLLMTNYDGANWLLINHGGRYFDNSSAGLGPTDSYNRTENAAIIDVDRDGWMDIVLLNDGSPARLLKGRSGGQFDEATASSGLNAETTSPRFGQSQSWGDFNGDGYPDLFITRAADKAEMYLNNGKNAAERFRLVYSGYPGGGQYTRIASAIEDFDGDGLTDLLITRTSQFGTNSDIPRDRLYLGTSQGYPLIDDESTTNTDPIALELVEPLRSKRETSLPVAADFDRDGDIDILYVNYLPDNASDLFKSSPLPLVYMRNNTGRANTLTIVLKRADNRNLPGTSVRLFHSGRSYWKTVSGGGGRIQGSPYLTFSLGTSSYADSLIVRWPDGVEQTKYGPFPAGEFELVVDFTGPTMALLSGPEGEAQGEYATLVTSSFIPFEGSVKATDNGGISQVSMIAISPSAGRVDTSRLTENGEGEYGFVISSPAPGDSLHYYFVASDTYGNSARLPKSTSVYYTLYASEGRYIGDVKWRWQS